MNGDPERLARLDDRSRHVDIGAAWRGIATWVVVNQDHRCRLKLQCSRDHLADMEAALVDRPSPHQLVLDQVMAGVEIEDAHAFDLALGKVCSEVIDQRLPCVE